MVLPLVSLSSIQATRPKPDKPTWIITPSHRTTIQPQPIITTNHLEKYSSNPSSESLSFKMTFCSLTMRKRWSETRRIRYLRRTMIRSTTNQLKSDILQKFLMAKLLTPRSKTYADRASTAWNSTSRSSKLCSKSAGLRSTSSMFARRPCQASQSIRLRDAMEWSRTSLSSPKPPHI